ncbi:anthranilate phosphoribosyltransferase [bacterium]|nr:anthranilate phosphoribosyltransferase [bacterium]
MNSLFPQIKKLIGKNNLSSDEICDAFEVMVSGASNPAQVASMLTLLHQKGETPDEIYGFTKSLLAHAVKIMPQTKTPCIDTCGTGGDGLNTFNISTAAMFILAAAKIPVAKHGNRGITSKSGSADVLAELGVKIDMSPCLVRQCIESINIGFMFAPLYHPSLKYISAVRKNLPFRTVFNILGPLVNPATAKRQIIGVFHPDFIPILIDVLKKLGKERAVVFSGEVPEKNCYMDEISPFGQTICMELKKDGIVEKFTIDNKNLNISSFKLDDIKGGCAVQNAKLIIDILTNKSSVPARDVIKLNAAAGLYIYDKVGSIADGVIMADEILCSGKPFEVLEQWKLFSG